MGDDDHEEDDDHEGGVEEDEGREAQDRQEGAVGHWQEERACHEEAGNGIFAKKSLSDALAAICGAKSLARTEVTKKVWEYIKKNKLNEGRTIKPDTKLKAIFPVASIDMLKMAGMISKHLS